MPRHFHSKSAWKYLYSYLKNAAGVFHRSYLKQNFISNQSWYRLEPEAYLAAFFSGEIGQHSGQIRLGKSLSEDWGTGRNRIGG
jgi:hypothetical protein